MKDRNRMSVQDLEGQLSLLPFVGKDESWDYIQQSITEGVPASQKSSQLLIWDSTWLLLWDSLSGCLKSSPPCHSLLATPRHQKRAASEASSSAAWGHCDTVRQRVTHGTTAERLALPAGERSAEGHGHGHLSRDQDLGFF